MQQNYVHTDVFTYERVKTNIGSCRPEAYRLQAEELKREVRAMKVKAQ